MNVRGGYGPRPEPIPPEELGRKEVVKGPKTTFGEVEKKVRIVWPRILVELHSNRPRGLGHLFEMAAMIVAESEQGLFEIQRLTYAAIIGALCVQAAEENMTVDQLLTDVQQKLHIG